MNLAQSEAAWIAKTPVYYAPEPIYKYFQWEKSSLAGAPFSSETNVPNGPITNLRNDPVIVGGAVEARWYALVDGAWMAISRLYESLDAFKDALRTALLEKGAEADAIAILDTSYADSVLDIGVSVLEASEQSLDFGESATELTVEVSNTGDARLNWEAISSLPEKVTIDPAEGKILPGGDAVVLTITVDRTDVPPGEYTPTITISGDNDSAAIELAIIVP